MATLTIPDGQTRVQYTVTTPADDGPFTIPFSFFETSDIVVVITDAAGVDTTLTEITEYTVTGTAADDNGFQGGTVDLVTGVTNSTVTISAAYTIERTTDFPTAGGFDINALNNQLDKIFAILQQIEGERLRSLLSPIQDDVSLNMALPDAIDRASKFLSFDANGAPLAAAGTSANLGPVSAFIDTLLDDVDAATARATLGAQVDLDVPSQAEAEAGTATTERVWTAQRVKQAIAALATLPAGHIQGLVPSNNGTDAAHDIDISAGRARDGGNAADLVLSAALTKQIDAVWAVGTNAGGLDTGAVANTTRYYLWLIRRSDTGVVDALFSTSATAPTMPTNYDQKRRIGMVLTDGSANILGFTALELAGGGLDIVWNDPPLDHNSTITTTETLITLSVPTAYSVFANINVSARSTGGAFNQIDVREPDRNDEAAANANAGPLASVSALSNASSFTTQKMLVRTDASGRIGARADANTNDFDVATIGWQETRV